MIRHLRTAEGLAYLVSAAFLVACLNWANITRHIVADGSAGAAAGRIWTYGVGAIVALAIGLALRFASRMADR